MAAYVLIYDSRRWVRTDSPDSTVVLPVIAGGTGTTTATGTAGSVVLSISPALTGTPTAPTAAAATSTTQIATTAFVWSTYTSSGTISNKTIDNTNTITVKDANFTLQDDGDTTKQMKFQLSGFTTGQTRTKTFPDADGTVAELGTANVFTTTQQVTTLGVGGAVSGAAQLIDAQGTTATALTIRVRNGGTAAGSIASLLARQGDGTTSSRKAFSEYFSSETTTQDWIAGMNGTKSFVIRDNTAGNDRVTVDQTTGAMTLTAELIQPNAPGSFTLPTEQYAVISDFLSLTGTQEATLQGTATVSLT